MRTLILIGVSVLAALLLAMGGCGSAGHKTSGAADDDAAPDDDASPVDDDDNDDASPPPDPARPGPYDFGYADLTFHDPSSNKDQPLRAYYPAAGAGIDDADGPRPLIVFGPGFALPMSLYFSYAEHLASYGYIVVLRDNYVISHLALAQTTSAIIDWVESQAKLAGSIFYDKVDLTRIGTSGHSLGGKISLLTAYDDKRVTASGTIDPVDTSPLNTPAYPAVTPGLMPDIHIPTLLLGSSDGGLCAPLNADYRQFYLYANPPSIEIEIEKSGHLTFCDLPDAVIDAAAIICPTGGGDFEQIRELANRYLAAFYKVEFDGDTAYAYYLTGAGMAHDVAAGLVATADKPGK
jgi:dienelactone hydrolase